MHRQSPAIGQSGFATSSHCVHGVVHRCLPLRSCVRVQAVASAREAEGLPRRRDVLRVALAAATSGILIPSSFVGAAQAGAEPAPAVAIVKEAFSAFGKFQATGDPSALLAVLSDDIRWSTNISGGYTANGKQGVLQFFKWADTARTLTQFKPVKFLLDDDGDEVVVFVNVKGSGTATGKPFAVTMVQTFVLDLKGAKITAFNEICGDTAKWNAAVAATNPTLL